MGNYEPINHGSFRTLLITNLFISSFVQFADKGYCNSLSESSQSQWEKLESEQILDTTFPIIIKENRNDSNLSDVFSSSYFGYTVSLTKVTRRFSQDPHGWIFIGAPKSNATSSMYQTNAVEPGVIWRCSLGRNHSDSCEMVNVDPVPRSGRRPANTAPMVESHNSAWIGGAMELNYGRLLTCGMRWNRGKRFYNGICYWFADENINGTRKTSYKSNDLSNLVDENLYDQRLTTFFREKLDQDKLFTYNNSKNEPSFGHEWQISQAGISVHLFMNGSNDKMPQLLIGAPGVREWGGAVVLYTNTKTPKDEMSRPNRNWADPTFSEFLVGNRASIPDAVKEGDRSNWNEYFGYAVTSGKYFRNDNVLYAAGAPRASHSGEVIIFSLPPYQKERDITYKRDIESVLEIKAPKKSFASYFGSVLHTVDLEGDGVDELIVGAPLFTFSSGVKEKESKDGVIKQGKDNEQKSEKVKRENPSFNEEVGDQGCVFIYKFNCNESKVRNESSNSSEVQPLQFLVGSKASRGRFGSAIMSILFNYTNGSRELYLVVGAPYETPEEDTFSSGSGAVYLYLFNKNTGKFSNNLQRIFASRIDPSLNGFGSSLSIPTDVDGNDTPDLAIGSYKSGAAVVLRTRPKILLKGGLAFFSEKGIEINEVRRGVHQFYLKSCFNVEANLGRVNLNLDIWVKIRFLDKTIHFHEDLVNGNPGSSRNEIIYMRSIQSHNRGNCENLTVIADHKDGIGMDDSDTLKEIVLPFHFTQEIKYNETLRNSFSPRILYAFDGVHASNYDGKPVDFDSFGSLKPSPQIFKLGADLKVSPTDCLERICQPQIDIKWTFLSLGNENISAFLLGSGRDIIMRLNITNLGETGVKPSLYLDWNMTQIRESTSGGRWLHRTCSDYSDTIRKAFRCPLGQHIKKMRSILIDIRLNMENIYADRRNIPDFIVNGAVSFEDWEVGRFNGNTVLPLRIPETTIRLMGSRENDSMLRTPFLYITQRNDFGVQVKEQHDETLLEKEQYGISNKQETLLYSSFRQRFTVAVHGASVSKATVNFQIPVTYENINRQLILVKGPLINTDSVQCKPKSKLFGYHTIQLHDNYLLPGQKINLDSNFDQESENEPTVNKYLVLNPNFSDVPSPGKSRRKRNANETTFSIDNFDNTSHASINTGNYLQAQKQISKEEKLKIPENALKLACKSERDCFQVQCTITNLKANTLVHIPFEMYPVKEIIDKILKISRKTALFIETSALAQIFYDELQEDHEVSQTILIKIPGKEADLWVYVAAGICGVLSLALIIIGLYKCGFFKREKLQQLKEMQAEHNRKNKSGNTRTSLLESGGSVMGIVQVLANPDFMEGVDLFDIPPDYQETGRQTSATSSVKY